ncbi:DUF2283 domain-containing protein [Acuticoccus sp. I52.16.1]|uniref:DUF2283 domain-containing protein n=1 Tax=Acuticoccus sp. I52.16.1 TaxID=2928472 RepID=UPI001FD0F4B9|nr:DUF2283 domain-containing protein [Acuticoccus sp. I52.16.1]UOM36285.1 DUF2283 domain-containing protein [Acuticoccus sp. I52.16.1]
MKPTITYDPEADAAYITLSSARVLESEEVRPGVVFDYDDTDRIVGIEVLGARGKLGADTLAGVAIYEAALNV